MCLGLNLFKYLLIVAVLAHALAALADRCSSFGARARLEYACGGIGVARLVALAAWAMSTVLVLTLLACRAAAI
jgi:hypothetical protein